MREQQTPAPFGGAQPGDIIRLGRYPLAEFLRVVKVEPPNRDDEFQLRAHLLGLRAVDAPEYDAAEPVFILDGLAPIKVVGKWTADDEQWEGE